MSWDLEEKNEYSVPYIKEGLTYIVMDAKLPSQMGTPEVRGYCIRIDRELPPHPLYLKKGSLYPLEH